MSIKTEKIEKNTIKLEITVDQETFETGMQKSYQLNVKKFNIPGFRKGKASRKIIEKFYGESVFYEDAINSVCPEAYEKALVETGIETVARPEIDIIQIGTGSDLIFSATVTVKPEVKLGKYKGVEVEEEEIKISSKDVDQEIEKLREKNSRTVEIEDKPVKNGDITTIDFEGFVDGVAFSGGKGENYELTIGSGQFIPGFEEQIIGAKIGEVVNVNVKFPEEYHSPDLAGKDSLFVVKVNSIKAKELPAIDDEFAKDVSEFDTISELKKSIKQKLQESAEHQAKHEFENKAIKVVADNCEVEIPQVMIKTQIETMAKDFDMRLKYQGLDLNKYIQMTGSSFEKFAEELKPQAEEQVKGRLALEAVVKAEKLESSDDELENEINKLAENYKQNVDEFKQHLREEDIKYIKEGIVFDKAIEFIVKNAKTKKK